VRPLFSSRSREAAELASTLARLAETSLPLLLEGETGSGKSFIAARIHRRSRPGRPHIVVDCGALPATLLPAELFGHLPGAFTDATGSRQGLLARAGEGTAVLDRVDALPPESQAVLLRVLEERQFTPVGASTSRPFAGRVIALADTGLPAKLASGAFRSDLYHRLAGFHAELPPLRRRQEDILPFARAALRRHGRSDLELDGEAEELLEAYSWPGNFRELDGLAARLCLLVTAGRIRGVDLGLPAAAWPAMAELAVSRNLPLGDVERLYALSVLAHCRGNVTRAAGVLGVSRRTLIRWRGTR
jgi:DNA-binding NtrC family response regulator